MKNTQNVLNAYALETIRIKTLELINAPGFTETDQEDIAQELTVHLIQRLPKFDPKRASMNTFISRVVDRKAANLIRHRTCEMRDFHREDCSLNENIIDGDGLLVPRSETISDPETEQLPGGPPFTAQEKQELLLDIEAVLPRLPEHLRRLCGLLKTMSISEAARKMRLPRTTVNDHVRALREAFSQEGACKFRPDSSVRS